MNALYILDDSPWFEWIRLRSTDSTNHFLRHYRPVSPKDMVLSNLPQEQQQQIATMDATCDTIVSVFKTN